MAAKKMTSPKKGNTNAKRAMTSRSMFSSAQCDTKAMCAVVVFTILSLVFFGMVVWRYGAGHI